MITDVDVSRSIKSEHLDESGHKTVFYSDGT